MKPKVEVRTVTGVPEGRWIKVYVYTQKVEELGMGLIMGTQFQEMGLANLCYFARYTAKPHHLEFQVLTRKPIAHLRRFVMGFHWHGMQATKVKFEPCNGSIAHAMGFQAVVALLAAGELTNWHRLCDVMHWMSNMAGFSYVQESMIAVSHIHNAMRSIPGYTDAPAFGLRKVEEKRSVLKKGKK